jgi:PKD repeat protein
MVKTDYIIVEPRTPPVTDFVADVTSGDAPLVVTFTDASTNNPTSWAWEFGDGSTSIEQNPVHTYSAGTYTVNLTVNNADGSDKMVKTDYILVSTPKAPPVADFGADVTSGDAPLVVTFTDASTNNPTSWAWEFGDGSTSTDQDPVHTYSAGTYTVNLTVDNADGSDKLVKTDYISVSTPKTPPVADFTGSPTSGNEPLDVTFSDASTNNPASWAWEFGDGSTSTDQNPVHTYSAGTYTVNLTVNNADGSDKMVKTNYIMVSTSNPQKGPRARFVAFPHQGQAPLTVRFKDLSRGNPTSWSWDFGDGSTLSTDQSPVHTYTNPGKYNVSLTVRNSGGSNTETQKNLITVKAEKPPRAEFSANPRQGLAPLTVRFKDLSRGNPASWSWDFGDGSTLSTEQNPVHIYTTPGKYNISLTVTNGAGSDTKIAKSLITVKAQKPPKAEFSANPRQGLAPLTVRFRDLSLGKPTSWSWDFENDGVVDSTEQNPVHTYTTPGKYNISLTVTNGAGSDTKIAKNLITVKAQKPPRAEFSANPRQGLAPLTVRFRDLSLGKPTSWSWDFGDGSTLSTEQNPVYTYTNPGKYTVTLTVTNNGGTDTAVRKDVINVAAPKVKGKGDPGAGTTPGGSEKKSENNSQSSGSSERPKIKIS